MPGNGQPRGTDWCFTINNYTEDEKRNVDNLVENAHAIYACYGIERGEGGTPHLQGFVQLRSRVRLNSVKSIPGFGRAHLETRRGSVQQAIEYCEKEGDFHEFGEKKSQGQRTDLASVKEAIDSGATPRQLWDSHFGSMVRYERSFKRYRESRCSRDPNTPVEVFVIWGGTGTGKSRFARLVDPSLFSIPDVTLQWWDGYEQQEVVLFDDFDGKDCPVARFLRYTDRYDVTVPIKGGFSPLTCRRIWITANTSPDDWFPNELQVKRDAVRRRLTRVVELVNPIRFENQQDIDHVKILLNLN